MTADNADSSTNDDVKARMREALARKQSNDRGVEQKGHAHSKGTETHGAVGGKREFRRKSG